MKIYKFEWKEITDWVAAKNKKEAIEIYKSDTGCDDFGITKCKITALKRYEWSQNYFIDPDNPEPDEDDPDYDIDFPHGHNEENYCNGYFIEMSFEEYMKDCKHAGIIASTEF